MRKVLSFVLVLTLVLSSFSMAFAATPAASAGLTDVAGNANADAIQVNYDLGIVTGNPDGTFLPEKAVTRAEFAAMLTRALDIPDSALAGYTTTTFKDTAGYAWAVPYLAFCQSKGIMLGDGNGNVMPGRTISVNEAMTMALRAIGYTANSSLLVGAWPANYVSIAQNNDLYDNVAKTTTVDKANAAQIIYNLLTVQKVSVNTDGSTDYLWKGKASDNKEANLLNTNLGATATEDVVLGTSGLSYDDSLINVSKDLGAYGDAYLNSDDNVIAFTKSSTALTGKLNTAKDEFEVGDIHYDLGTNSYTTQGVFFLNGDVDGTGKNITAGAIFDEAKKADDGETVTLNVDLSGKTIKDIYSLVAWKATTKDKAASDVQDDIANKELLSTDFAKNDNDNIDMKSFELVGAASLEKIAKDNVVYVYESTKDSVIRKVAVGTETVQGTVDEVDFDGSNASTITIGGKGYDVSANATDDAKGVDVDNEGTLYLDYQGEVYDFSGTNTVNTYGVVKANEAEGVNNFQVKLYTSEDSTKTFALSDELAKMSYTSDNCASGAAFLTTGALIGYSLDGDGNIEKIDNTVTAQITTATIASAKVLTIAAGDKTIKSDAVIITYDDTKAPFAEPNGVAAPGDLSTGGIANPIKVIYNKDGDIIAMYISDKDADVTKDTIYGVIDSRTTAKNADGDKVYKYKGYIDGTAFTYLTDTGKAEDPISPFFGVYGFNLDSNDAIKTIDDLTLIKSVSESKSGYIVLDATLKDVSSDRTLLTDTNDKKWTVDDKAVVYKYSVEDKEFTVSKLSSIRKEDVVSLFDTEGKDADGVADVVIYWN